MTDQIDHLRLVRTEGIGPVTYRRLLDRYFTPAAVLDALPVLARAGGRMSSLKSPSRAEAEREIEATLALGAQMVFLGDANYPPLLGLLDDAPPCLIVMGDIMLAQAGCVAVVGGRNASANGRRMAETLAADLAHTLVVASGLARGIDTAAHRGAMTTGKTIAVVAGGIDQPYPLENAELHRRIGDTDLLLTEAPVGTVPQARHFPRRNRIIAGVSLGVVVVEAALRSGSLITARLAQDAGREVFAVPGSPLEPRARRGNDLIRQGAILVETVADIMANMPLEPAAPAFRRFGSAAGLHQPPSLDDDPTLTCKPSDAHAEVLSLLSPDSTTVDDLIRRCQLSSSVIMAVLLELELAGRVETRSGNRIALLPDAVY